MTFIVLIFAMTNLQAQNKSQFPLFTRMGSEYQIVSPTNSSLKEQKAAKILQEFIFQVSSHRLPISDAPKSDRWSIIPRVENRAITNVKYGWYSEAKNIIIFGVTQDAVLTASYQFIEKIIGCKKLAAHEPASCPEVEEIMIDFPLQYNHKPRFNYSEIYGSSSTDLEFQTWYGLDYLEDQWGLWGHSFSKLVSPSLFKTHPDYFSFFEGKRRPNQLCLSHPDVYELIKESISKLILENPDATYFSISPNDDIGFCSCRKCRPINNNENGPMGPLLLLINRIASDFPSKQFTTLAYGAYRKPASTILPRENVTIILSSIEVSRNLPIEQDPTGREFKKLLNQWLKLSPNLWIWDYYTQFSNYLNPFPVVHTIAHNIEYYDGMKVKGIFAQLAEGNYDDLTELKAYVLAKEFVADPGDKNNYVSDFIQAYYGHTASLIQNYVDLLTLEGSKLEKKLDIYANPIFYLNHYLSLKNIEKYEQLLDKANLLANTDLVKSRVQKLQMNLLFAKIQQARFLGYEEGGLYWQTPSGDIIIDDAIKSNVDRFFDLASKNQISVLSEEGWLLSDYEKEWQLLLSQHPKKNIAFNLKPSISHPFLPDFPSKGANSLTDGILGFNDFSYNWLLFDDTTDIILDLNQTTSVKEVTINALNDPRHWIFLPKTLKLSISTDGLTYQELQTFRSTSPIEDYTKIIKPFHWKLNHRLRFLKLEIGSLKVLPKWRQSPSKKPLFAIDEILVQ